MKKLTECFQCSTLLCCNPGDYFIIQVSSSGHVSPEEPDFSSWGKLLQFIHSKNPPPTTDTRTTTNNNNIVVPQVALKDQINCEKNAQLILLH